ncbi:MAG: glycosyltransferase family protein [Candidatus Omnitrophica bacterium]|nr:glycosyltransferase family protein [Candidatus Omnitrophota bacterium]
MRIGIIIQARVESTRLPKKALLPLPYGSKISVLEQVIRRAKQTEGVNEIIVASPESSENNIIESLSRALSVRTFRGDALDVLSRFFYAAQEHTLDTIIRLTADNPCIDCTLIGAALNLHCKKGNDYTTTKGYPLGLNVEIVSFNALKKAFTGNPSVSEKEHVTSFIYSNPETFKVSIKNAEKKYYSPDIRVTLDTQEDYALLCSVFDHLYAGNKYFGVHAIVDLFRQKPWLKLINKKVIQKTN